MHRSYSITLSAAALLAFVGVVAVPAEAAPPVVAESTAVRYSGLDLDSAAGVATLYARVQAAAEKVCDARFHPGTRVVSASWRTCVADAISEAVAALDRPSVTAYHASNASFPEARSANRLAARN